MFMLIFAKAVKILKREGVKVEEENLLNTLVAMGFLDFVIIAIIIFVLLEIA